ncbi:hypothetical protein J1N35_042361 [Gossypium stocksii]|uniref:BHLH domain-containing protein n=1 Tax=Gossypium stocksii TaxID=47602 RepID=A0A9D3ZK88_9ROSI|nr:hypothetical protein J1N35_042361 [Gossypium stocksii]
MEIPSVPHLSLTNPNSKQSNHQIPNSNGRSKVNKHRRIIRKKQIKCGKPRTTVRRCRGNRRSSIGTKLRTLRKLIPAGNGSVGFDALFNETARYILFMQMKIKAMEIMTATGVSVPSAVLHSEIKAKDKAQEKRSGGGVR